MSSNIEKTVNTKNWSCLVAPERLIRSKDSSSQHGKFSCEPLERGFGLTLGNALRRVLLSSLQGAAIVSINIRGVQHEFTTISGIIEDVTDIVLNFKQVRLLVTSNKPQRLVINVNKKGIVTANDIQENQNVKILNKDLHLATLSEDREFYVEIEVRTGKGYVPADMLEGMFLEIGTIVLDASFSPVKKVSYTVEQARVGQMTNYDKLLLDVVTDGSISPDDALAYSAKILKEQLDVFVNFDEQQVEIEQEQTNRQQQHNPNLFKKIDDLELPVRAGNCLKSAGITWVGELVQKTEGEMLKTKNFGRKSLEDICVVLNSLDLDFGMELEGFTKLLEDWQKRKDNDEA